jgi:hypothetical protein
MATRNGRLVHDECEYSVQNTATNGPTSIHAGPALLMGVYVNTVLSAHTVVLADATTAIVTLPASLAAGTMVSFPGLRFETSLNIDPDDSSTGNLTIMYRKVNPDT